MDTIRPFSKLDNLVLYVVQPPFIAHAVLEWTSISFFHLSLLISPPEEVPQKGKQPTNAEQEFHKFHKKREYIITYTDGSMKEIEQENRTGAGCFRRWRISEWTQGQWMPNTGRDDSANTGCDVCVNTGCDVCVNSGWRQTAVLFTTRCQLTSSEPYMQDK